jgi:hypothetical protein
MMENSKTKEGHLGNLGSRMMDEYTLKALRTLANQPGKPGKALGIQGICDMVEEYLGVNRDIFRRELVKSRAILDGALLMWQKKQNKVAEQYLNDEVTYEELTDMDLYYIDLYYLYPTPTKTFDQHVNAMHFTEGMLTEAEMAAQYAADEAAHQAAMEEEWAFQIELDQAVDTYYDRWG